MRICSFPTDREKRFSELRSLLLSRDYKAKIIDSAIEKAREIPRTQALKRVHKEKSSSRPVFVVNYDPRLPSIPGIINKHWRTMTQDPRLKEIFPEPPLVAYKRPQNIRDKVIRSKVPPLESSRPKRNTPGMKKCHKCAICPFVLESPLAKATATNFKININYSVDCSTKNIIYLLGCRKCPQQYIGETERSLRERFTEHKGYVNTKNLTKATGIYFNEKGPNISDMQISIIEKVLNQDPQFRKQREKMFIQKFNSNYKGLNKSNGG